MRKREAWWLFFAIAAFFFARDTGSVLYAQAPSAPLQIVAMQPARPQPGELFQIVIRVSTSIHSVRAAVINASGNLLCQFKGFPLAVEKETFWIISCVVPCTASLLEYSLTVETPDILGGKIQQALTLTPKTFLSETITFDKNLSALRTVPDPQKVAESEALQALFYKFDTSLPLGSPVIKYPLSTIRKTAFFGDRRVYVYENGTHDTTIHNGIDFGGNQNPVEAPGSGTIVFAQPRIVTGNTIILQHAPGVYSLFYHLSEIGVQAGAFVEAGTILGKTGSTGLATGPHLHWEVRCQGEAADPEALMLNGLIDIHTLPKLLSATVFP